MLSFLVSRINYANTDEICRVAKMKWNMYIIMVASTLISWIEGESDMVGVIIEGSLFSFAMKCRYSTVFASI